MSSIAHKLHIDTNIKALCSGFAVDNEDNGIDLKKQVWASISSKYY